MDVFNSIVSWVGDKINIILSFVALALPDSPFTLLDKTPIAPYLSYINYFVPLDFICDVLAAWTSAILIFYGFQIILRWAKAAASS